MKFISTRVIKSKEWWQAPIKPGERFTSSIISGFAGFWIGGLGRIILGPPSVTLENLFYFALGGVVLFMALGAAFPKTMRIISFPFAIFGITGGS